MFTPEQIKKAVQGANADQKALMESMNPLIKIIEEAKEKLSTSRVIITLRDEKYNQTFFNEFESLLNTFALSILEACLEARPENRRLSDNIQYKLGWNAAIEVTIEPIIEAINKLKKG